MLGSGKKAILIIQVRTKVVALETKRSGSIFEMLGSGIPGVFVMVGRIGNGVDEGAILSRQEI